MDGQAAIVLKLNRKYVPNMAIGNLRQRFMGKTVFALAMMVGVAAIVRFSNNGYVPMTNSGRGGGPARRGFGC